MTDARLGEQLWDALAAMPRGSGVVFRHYELARAERLALFRAVRQVARRRGLTLVVGGPAAGFGPVAGHGRYRGAWTAPVHSRAEAVRAVRNGAKLLFVSPVYTTRSHPNARELGRVRLGQITRGLKLPVIALGGMDERRWRKLGALDIYGWAGIDAWLQ